MLKLLQYCNYIIIVMQMKLMLLLLLLLTHYCSHPGDYIIETIIKPLLRYMKKKSLIKRFSTKLLMEWCLESFQDRNYKDREQYFQ